MGAVAEWLRGGAAAPAERVDPSAGVDLPAFLVHQVERPSDEQGAARSHANDGDPIARSHEERFRAEALPPLRPAAFFFKASYWSSFFTLGLSSGITGHLHRTPSFSSHQRASTSRSAPCWSSMQNLAAGRAANRSAPIGLPHASQVP